MTTVLYPPLLRNDAYILLCRIHMLIIVILLTPIINFYYVLALDKSVTVIETLRDLKSSLEGSAIQYESTTVCDATLHKIKQLMLMHTPQSLSLDDRDRLVALIKETFQGVKNEWIYYTSIVSILYNS